MTTQMALTSPHPPRLLRSTVAVLSGFLAVVILSIGTDQVLHVLEVYPPWGQPMHDAGLNLLALAYRTAYTVFGGYIAARLAPYAPMRHALVLGVLGLAVGLASAIVTITKYDLGPDWYPIALVLIALPGTLLGGVLRTRQAER